MAVYSRSDVPSTGTITGGTDTSGDANINDELNNIISVLDGSGSFDATFKQSVTINDSAGAFDTQIKGDADDNLVYVDASADRVGVGTATPSAKLHVCASDDSADAEFAILDSTSASPADNDVRRLPFHMSNDGAASEPYAQIKVTATDVSSGTEKGKFTVATADGVDGSVDDIVDIDIDGLDVVAGDIKKGGSVLLPAGTVTAYTADSAPSGWLECNGSNVSRTTYADLFTAIGVIYGNGDGSTTFTLPDYRGRFLRGFDNAAGTDPDAGSRTDRGDGTTGDAVGTQQDDAFQGHGHTIRGKVGTGSDSGKFYTQAGGSSNVDWSGAGIGAIEDTIGGYGSVKQSTETRPTNINVMYIIKT